MALFGFKKDKKEKAPAVSGGLLAESAAHSGDAARSIRVIRQPRITEKASFLSEANRVYVFEIAPQASKKEVAESIKALYKVTPRDVHIARNPAKRVFIRGKKGRKPGVKKAYVYLKEGDKIEMV